VSRRIEEVTVTPVAFRDPPLLNAAGVHEPWCLRAIIELRIEGGAVGLGETYGDAAILRCLTNAAPRLAGLDVLDLNGLGERVRQAVAEVTIDDPESSARTSRATLTPRIFGAFEVACWDAFGKATGTRVCDLLGGQVRERIPFAAYLFYKFARHRFDPTAPVDPWGEALTPEGIVEQARRMVELFGFKALKLKAGVLEPEAEIAAMRALREAFPEAPLRIDPNGAWHVHTTLKLLPQMEGLLEYLEDPTLGIPGMAVIQAATAMPLATNMCVVAFDHLPPGIRQDAVRIVLSDHHYWGGLAASRELARICATWGLGLSMHSNSHLGISLAAMAHLAAATPNLTYDCDTHYPWQDEDLIEGGRLAFEQGTLALPQGPGLGVTLDRVALARMHADYLACGIRKRDDATEMRKYQPDWPTHRPRF
jgi:glucarate dehydratase